MKRLIALVILAALVAGVAYALRRLPGDDHRIGLPDYEPADDEVGG